MEKDKLDSIYLSTSDNLHARQILNSIRKKKKRDQFHVLNHINSPHSSVKQIQYFNCITEKIDRAEGMSTKKLHKTDASLRLRS